MMARARRRIRTERNERLMNGSYRQDGLDGRIRKPSCLPAFLPFLPILPLEAHFESELKLPLFGARWIDELIGIRRNGRGRVSQRVDDSGGGDPGQLLEIERVLQLGDDFRTDRPAQRDRARIADVEV